MRLVALFVACSTTLGGSCGRIVPSHGVRVVVPPGWMRVRPAPPGAVTDPRTILVAGTVGVRPKPSRCPIAAYRVPPAGAVVVVVRWKELGLSGAGGQKEGRWPLKSLTAVRRPSFDCFQGRGAVATLVLRGKAYQVNVLVGDRAGKQRVAEALAVARSFDLTR